MTTGGASSGTEFDIVCVGGGIAGSGLAAVLAQGGNRCLVLESTEVFPDRTKGEWIAPWGVVEATRLGLLDVVRSARGHSIARNATCDETTAGGDPDVIDFTMFAPFPLPLTQRHPDLCQALFDHAGAMGATTVRPVSDVSVERPAIASGSSTVRYTADGVVHEVKTRLVIAADGRNSSVRRQRVPGIDAFRGVTIESPCSTYSNEDAWLETPVHDGVVFVGDAAGWNDPIIGQGLAITFCDIRVLSELLLADGDWGASALAPYVAERKERMRRLQFAAAYTSVLRNEFGPAAAERRRRIRALTAERPDLMLTGAAAIAGPDFPPAEAFSAERWQELVGA